MTVDDIPLSILIGSLLCLLVLSGLFSGTETGMMAINRYRLRHLAKEGRRAAVMVESLLSRPDRLIGLVLFGNNLVNFLAVSIATVVAIRLLGEIGLAAAPLVLTPLVLIFGEVAPKTLAALHPERFAFPAAYVLVPLGKVFNPIVMVVNWFANAFLGMLGVDVENKDEIPMTREELRTVVMEAGAMIPRKHQRMLLSILDLESVSVEDIMVPRSEIFGLDLADPPEELMEVLDNSQHTRLPVYRDNIDNVVGMLHLRQIPRLLRVRPEYIVAEVEKALRDPYFIPLGTPLHKQLLNFQRRKLRMGLVVDEYGVIQGLATLEDILEEIVGEFTTDAQTLIQDIHPQEDGSFVIDGGASIRDINRQLHWTLPADGPRTLNGVVLEHLETMPEPGTSLRIGEYAMEVIQTGDNAVRTVRVLKLPEPEMPEDG